MARSGEKWGKLEKVGKSDEKWLNVVKSGEKLEKVGKSWEKRKVGKVEKMGKSGEK